MPETTRGADRASRVLDLFAEVRELPAGERELYLEQLGAGDAEVVVEVRSLLRYESQAEGFLAQPVIGSGAAVLAQEVGGTLGPGVMLGEYRVVSLLGAGGMGEVYLAEDTVHGRQVALKLIGKDRAEEVRGRYFRHERRMLAGLNHPSIARLYGSGVTLEGQAYLVMEYVDGERLDNFCRDRRLEVGARLTLFRKVCAAVTHAHQNLVVHRDLKPANIRVTAEGEPKLLDFGIAKLLEPEGSRLGEPTVTMDGALTPSYASPEQLRGEPITTATDVYSLGVILYELLTGQRPYEVRSRRPDEVARAICEEEPARPSTVVSRTGTGGGDDAPPALRRRLAGDLDTIVAKAMRKESARRYPSVSALSEDLRRHGEGLPVTARKDTLRYRAGKFIRRHKAGVAAGALVVLALVAGLIVATWQARVALRARDRAHLAQRQAERLNGFLEELLGSIDPSHMGRDVKVAQVLDAASLELDRELAEEPEVLAQAHGTLYRSYFHLGLFVPAEQHARAALELERRLHDVDDPATARAEIALARVLCNRSRAGEAEPLLRHALLVLRRQSVPDEAALGEVLGVLSYSLHLQGRAAQAEPLVAEALTHARAAWGEESSEYAAVLNELGNLKIGEHDYAAAEPIYHRLVELQDRLAPNGEHSVAPLINLCISLCYQEKWAEMRVMTDRLERDARRVFGEKSVYFAIAVYGHGVVAAFEGHYQTAIPLFQEALPLLAAAYSPGENVLVQCRVQLGLCLTRTGRAAEGEPLLRMALADGGKVDRAELAHTFGSLEIALGECLLAQKRYAEAEPLLLAGQNDLEKRLGPQNRFTLEADRRLHELYSVWNKRAEAAPSARDTTPIPR